MATVDAIRKITIQASTPGADQATQSLNNLVAAQNRVAASADQLRASMDASQKMLADNVSKLNDLKTANDNASGGFSGLAKNASEVSHNLASTVESTLSTIGHLKLLAVAAYAMSPAFRAITNSGVSQALSLMPPVMAQVTTSAVTLGARVLSMTASLTVPIAGAVIAWKGLNYIWSQGSDLLEKYGNQVRTFFASDVGRFKWDDPATSLAKLTALQPDDTISQQQIQYATELGARLTEAKKTISDFLTVTINVNDVSLKIQNAWVLIVEVIAKATGLISDLLDKLSGVLGTVASFVGSIAQVNPTIAALMAGAASLQGAAGPMSDADQMAAARSRLAAAMGGSSATFPYKRFSQGVNDLADTKDPDDPNKTNAYERSIQTLKDQIATLGLEADGAYKNSQAVEEMKVAHTETIAAMRAGIPVTDEMRAEWKKYADQISDLTIKVNQAKVAQEENFKAATMFMSPADAAAANAAKQIDPTNWMAHLNDVGPQLAAMNSQLTQARDLADGFADAFGQAMLQGKTAAQALNSALNSLASSLISMISKQLVNKALGSLIGMVGGSTVPLSGVVGQTVVPSAMGNVFDRGMIHPFALGGILSDIVLKPTMFPMANGAGLMGEAGPEAVMPLTRMSGGQLGVKANGGAGGNVQVIHNVVIENNSGAPATQTSSKNSSGGTDTRITIGAMMQERVGNGSLDKVMKSRFGIVPTTQQR